MNCELNTADEASEAACSTRCLASAETVAPKDKEAEVEDDADSGINGADNVDEDAGLAEVEGEAEEGVDAACATGSWLAEE